MPPIQDPALLAMIARQQQQPSVQPMPFPGAAPPMPTLNNPRQDLADAATQERIRLDRESGDRARESLNFSGQANNRAQTTADRETAEAGLTGGVNTTESENTAAFLTSQLSGHVRKINEVLKDHPEAIKPGWLETIGGAFGDRTRAMMTPDDVQDQRNVLNNRYGLAADVLLTLGTGAAYTAEQKKIYVESYAPKVTDGPETLADKKNMMKEALIAARAKSGAGVVQVDRAMKSLDELYAGVGAEEPEKQDVHVKADKASTTEKSLPFPKEYEQEYKGFFSKFKPGTLTADDYLGMRLRLDRKYEDKINELAGTPQGTPFSQYSDEDVQAQVDYYNKTGKLGGIDIKRKLNSGESHAADLANSSTGAVLANTANAATLGAVELAGGQQGRDNLATLNEEHPIAALTGEVAGSLAPLAGGAKGGALAIEKLFPNMTATARMKLLGDLGINGAYGAARGANHADEGEGGEGALKGAAEGLVGSAAGNFVTKGLNPLLSEGTSKALDQLKGVKLSTLQKLGLGAKEESLNGLPFAHGAREKSMASFNTDNANRALKWIGERVPKGITPGTETNAFLGQKINAAYNKIRPLIQGSEDGQYVNAMTALRAQFTGRGSDPAKREMFKEVADAAGKFRDANGHYTGDGYKEASERLRYLAKTWSAQAESQGSVAAGDMARVAETARKQMQHLIQRQTPAVGVQLKNLERTVAHTVRIENASNRALANNEAVYSPAQYLTTVKQLDTSARKNASARGKALDQPYGMAAQKVMGASGSSKVSVPGTLSVAAALGTTGYFSPAAAAAVTAIGAGLYGPGLKQTVQLILSGKRPDNAAMTALRFAISDATRSKLEK